MDHTHWSDRSATAVRGEASEGAAGGGGAVGAMKVQLRYCAALREALGRQGGLWFGWSGDLCDENPPAARIQEAGNILFATIPLTPADHDDFYVHYANATLWPLCHYRLGLIEFSRSAFEGYLRVNRLFAERLAPLLRPDDLIWIHDYHFFPLAAALRSADEAAADLRRRLQADQQAQGSGDGSPSTVDDGSLDRLERTLFEAGTYMGLQRQENLGVAITAQQRALYLLILTAACAVALLVGARALWRRP